MVRLLRGRRMRIIFVGLGLVVAMLMVVPAIVHAVCECSITECVPYTPCPAPSPSNNWESVSGACGLVGLACASPPGSKVVPSSWVLYISSPGGCRSENASATAAYTKTVAYETDGPAEDQWLAKWDASFSAAGSAGFLIPCTTGTGCTPGNIVAKVVAVCTFGTGYCTDTKWCTIWQRTTGVNSACGSTGGSTTGGTCSLSLQYSAACGACEMPAVEVQIEHTVTTPASTGVTGASILKGAMTADTFSCG